MAKTIYYVHDDRGCDVLASNKGTIMPLYNDYRVGFRL
ncbi:hypothetical protein DCE79_07205 [Lysinibacillus sp. 2017]|nr:hypothetical protein DCE79_07205 [Lysinibacillus sp. 2017]TGN34639.1 DUF3885 domain-containing protein [Lysinibacillus sp. S2017]